MPCRGGRVGVIRAFKQSLDHLIRPLQDRGRDRQTEGLGGLEGSDGFRAAADDREHRRAVLCRDAAIYPARTTALIMGGSYALRVWVVRPSWRSR